MGGMVLGQESPGQLPIRPSRPKTLIPFPLPYGMYQGGIVPGGRCLGGKCLGVYMP